MASATSLTMGAEIKKEKPWVRFGISPFGLWRPGYPEGTGKGALDPFDAIAADSLKWLRNGWCDYLAPQLYWSIDAPEQSFPALLKWWAGQNTAPRHLWPGLSAATIAPDGRRIAVTRAREQSPELAGKLQAPLMELFPAEGNE